MNTYNQIMKMILAPVYASFTSVLETLFAGAGSTLLGSLLGGGGGSTQQTQQQVRDVSGGGLFDTTGAGQITLTPEMQAIQQGLFGQAGGTPLGQQATELGAGFLGQVGEFDPFAAAQTQFGRMEDILTPGREQQRLAQESRLFSQGRLGSTGGAQQQKALEQTFSQQQAQNLAAALGQAQGIQGQQIQQGMALGAFAPQQQTQALQNLLGIQQGAMGQLGQTGLGGQTMTTPGVDPFGALGTGLMTGGAEMLGTGLEGLFTPRAPDRTLGGFGTGTGFGEFG